MHMTGNVMIKFRHNFVTMTMWLKLLTIRYENKNLIKLKNIQVT